jgi:thymidine kinase
MTTGRYLARCNNCGPAAFPDSASVYEIDASSPSIIWNVEKVGNQIAFVADSGKYLARCNNCWNKSTYPDAVFVQATSSKDQLALWKPIYIGYGKWVFRGNNGKYLTRCQSCVNEGSYP